MNAQVKFTPLALVILIVLPNASRPISAQDLSELEVADDRLELNLILEDPEIVTPIGLAIDPEDRIYVLESHTHARPTNYDGPKTDQVKRLIDVGLDGKIEELDIFAEGFEEGLNLAFSPDGVLFVVCSTEVIALIDADGDGHCERQETILRLITEEGGIHNRLLAITFDPEGWLYVTRGNTASRRYELRGRDGKTIRGYGDGGSIVRLRPDGTNLEEYATGFWNPFDLKFDRTGRLLCVDNDPDARGPNRLVHVVPDGDYGYRSLYGGGGHHPFQGWDGELPGTLPIAGATGEAPSGLIDCQQTSLPRDYADSLLVTIWNENSVEQHRLRQKGTTVQSNRSVLISGGKDFRPVALAADSAGNIYMTDWVLVDYPNHSRGKLWRISTRQREENTQLDPQELSPSPGIEMERLKSLYSLDPRQSSLAIKSTLKGDDPFGRHAATIALSGQSATALRQAWLRHSDPHVRLGALLGSRRFGTSPDLDLLSELLKDPNEQIRRAALIWAAEQHDPDLRPFLDLAIDRPPVSGSVFETYLAAVPLLEEPFIEAFRSQAASRSSQLPRKLKAGFLTSLVANGTLSDQVRALGIASMDQSEARTAEQLLIELAEGPTGPLKTEAIRKLTLVGGRQAYRTLTNLMTDRAQSTRTRIEALWGVAELESAEETDLLRMLEEPEDSIKVAAARGLSRFRGSAAVQQAAGELVALLKDAPNQNRLVHQLDFLINGMATRDRPNTLEAWEEVLARGGDPNAGRFVFFSRQSSCTQCHTIGGLGGTLGPDLSNVAQSSDRRAIIRSILEPSEQFAIQYQAWMIATTDGKLWTGLQIDHKARGAIELYLTEGRVKRFEADQIKDYRALSDSIMPDDLESNLSVEELRDLIAFLTEAK